METLSLPRKLSLPMEDIMYLESDSNYTNIITRDENTNHCVALSLCKIQIGLKSQDFIRINRSQIINKNYMISVNSEERYSTLTLIGGKTFKTSRRRTPQFLKAI